MSKRDWLRLRSQIGELTEHQRQYAAVGWTAVGSAAGGLFAALAWFPAYSDMADAIRRQYSWIGPTMVVLTVACLVIALLMFWAAKNTKDDIKRRVGQITQEMDTIPGAPTL